ncbi:hypothetical protein [Paenibacillus antarcticus]|nr:hypothetical protein [Paenibacillus antarcticus]
MAKQPLILIVEDEARMRELVADYFWRKKINYMAMSWERRLCHEAI